MKKLLIINGSPKFYRGNTFEALSAYGELLSKKYKYSFKKNEINFKRIPPDFQGCRDCGKCVENCNIRQYDKWFKDILNDIKECDRIILGSPVYLDMPTPQTVAFLTRLNCMTENTNREFFKGKKIYLVSTAYCSGTKQVISIMRNACEMLGFDIEGRSSREYIQLWKDKKIRGGMSKKDIIYLKEV
jgi:multimeric flavodoxin WrbA